MRTTFAIDTDLLVLAQTIASRRHMPFERVINAALRMGLQSVEQSSHSRTYQTRPHKMGLKATRQMENVQELLAHIEGEDHP
jgi:hypothetical protein